MCEIIEIKAICCKGIPASLENSTFDELIEDASIFMKLSLNFSHFIDSLIISMIIGAAPTVI